MSLASKDGSIDRNRISAALQKGDYPGLLDYYTRYSGNEIRHNLMAQHYRETIIDALKQFDSSYSDSIYEAIAWAGLKRTVAWESLDNSEKNRINKIYNEFMSKGEESCQ